MNLKQIKIDDKDILFDKGVIYTQIDWRKLSVSDNSTNIEGLHWRIVSPTYARYRIITIEWIIERIDGKQEERLLYLQKLFALQTKMYSLEEKEIYIKDLFDNEWRINAKIKEPFEFIEWDENIKWSHWKWRVVLESTLSPIYYSYKEIKKEALEWCFWGFYLWLQLSQAFNEWKWLIEIKTLQDITYTRIEIDIVWSINWNLVIKNLTNDSFFAIDDIFKVGDKIIIDSEKFTVTKNGINIIDKRVEGSIWQKVSWTMKFVVYDNDFKFLENDLNVKFYYSNAML